MDRIKKVALILAVVIACIVVDKLWIHLIRWDVIGRWIENLGRAIH